MELFLSLSIISEKEGYRDLKASRYKRVRKLVPRLRIGAPLLINFHPERRWTTVQAREWREGESRDKKRVLSRIDAIEPRIIHARGQNPAIFERGIGERNYTFWNRVQWRQGRSLKVEYLRFLRTSCAPARPLYNGGTYCARRTERKRQEEYEKCGVFYLTRN